MVKEISLILVFKMRRRKKYVRFIYEFGVVFYIELFIIV